MKTEIESAIKALIEKSKAAEKPNDATQFAQAALNLAHVLATVENVQNK